MPQELAVLEMAGAVATVFDKPRPIAEFENGQAWIVVRTNTGLKHGRSLNWPDKLDKLEPLPGGTTDDLVEKKLVKGMVDGHFRARYALNPNDPIPKVNFEIPNLERWRQRRPNYVDTGTAWVGRPA